MYCFLLFTLFDGSLIFGCVDYIHKFCYNYKDKPFTLICNKFISNLCTGTYILLFVFNLMFWNYLNASRILEILQTSATCHFLNLYTVIKFWNHNSSTGQVQKDEIATDTAQNFWRTSVLFFNCNLDLKIILKTWLHSNKVI